MFIQAALPAKRIDDYSCMIFTCACVRLRSVLSRNSHGSSRFRRGTTIGASSHNLLADPVRVKRADVIAMITFSASGILFSLRAMLRSRVGKNWAANVRLIAICDRANHFNNFNCLYRLISSF